MSASRASEPGARRLASLGAITASVAHEINNPAAFLLLGLDILGRHVAGGASPAELLGELKASTLHIVEVVRGLRLLASDTGVVPAGGVDLADAVKSALTLVRGRIAEVAEISVAAHDAPNVAMSSGGALWVAVSALLVAVESIPQGSEAPRVLHVETRRAEVRAEPHHDEVELHVRVSDTGPRAASASTDAATLALELAHATVHESRGSLRVDMPREPGKPAVIVSVRLPVSAG